MKPTHEIFDTLKVVVPCPEPFLVGVDGGILLYGIKECDDILLPTKSERCLSWPRNLPIEMTTIMLTLWNFSEVLVFFTKSTNLWINF
jgi:hypothetical protein